MKNESDLIKRSFVHAGILPQMNENQLSSSRMEVEGQIQEIQYSKTENDAMEEEEVDGGITLGILNGDGWWSRKESGFRGFIYDWT